MIVYNFWQILEKNIDFMDNLFAAYQKKIRGYEHFYLSAFYRNII